MACSKHWWYPRLHRLETLGDRWIMNWKRSVLEQLWPNHTPVTILNSHPTMNLYRFYAFAKQKSHNTSLLLLSALMQRHRHLVELFPRFLCVPQACQRRVLVALGHRLRIPYTQWHRSYERFLIQLFRFSTERTLYMLCCCKALWFITVTTKWYSETTTMEFSYP